MIQRVEPRRGVLRRTSQGRQHVIVANVDQLVIVTSAVEPVLKPNLIDRLIVSVTTNPSKNPMFSTEERLAMGITDSLVRLACGVEDGHDLIEDLAQALDEV